MRIFDFMVKHKRLVKIGSLALVAFFLVSIEIGLKPVFHRNLAYLSLCNAFAFDSIRATDRQIALAHAAGYFALANGRELQMPRNVNSDITMLHSLFIGEYYRSHDRMDEASPWYLIASQTDPIPVTQRSWSFTYIDRLTPEGDLLLGDFCEIEEWRPLESNSVMSEDCKSDGDALALFYTNTVDQRDVHGCSLSLYQQPLPLDYHNVLAVRVKLGLGTLLTIDLTLDNTIERVVGYYSGTGTWEILRFPLQGTQLQWLSIAISEPLEPSSLKVSEYEAWIDWVKLELTSN